METFEEAGLIVEIEQDEVPQSPREWDNLGVLVAWHPNYEIGDKDSPFYELVKNGPRHFEMSDVSRLLKELDIAVKLPVYLYDHSGLRLNTGGYRAFDPQGWDSGQVGFIYVTKEAVRAEYSVKRISSELLERVRLCLEGEVKDMDDFLSGQVWGYVIRDPKNPTKVFDSCWGFYGDSEGEVLTAGRAAAQYLAKTLTEFGRNELAGQEALAL